MEPNNSDTNEHEALDIIILTDWRALHIHDTVIVIYDCAVTAVSWNASIKVAFRH